MRRMFLLVITEVNKSRADKVMAGGVIVDIVLATLNTMGGLYEKDSGIFIGSKFVSGDPGRGIGSTGWWSWWRADGCYQRKGGHLYNDPAT
jgi:hypothetical protein